jgi:hypothetical protein
VLVRPVVERVVLDLLADAGLGEIGVVGQLHLHIDLVGASRERP